MLDAAYDLGAGPLHHVPAGDTAVEPPGVAAGFVFVLIPTTGEFIAPLLVGGPSSQLFGNSIQAFFSDTPDWNYGAVLALTLVVVVLILLAIFGRFIGADLTTGGSVSRTPGGVRREADRPSPAARCCRRTSGC